MIKLTLSRKRRRTRLALVEATAALIAERGLAGATLDDIAARAGVTKGAIYSNYRSKAELLWAAADRRRVHLRPPVTPGDPLAQARAFARAVIEALPQTRREADFYSELQAYVRTDPELRAQQAAQQTAQFDVAARRLQAALGDELDLPARAVVIAAQALALGFMTQWERTPDEVTEEVVTAAYEALARGATKAR